MTTARSASMRNGVMPLDRLGALLGRGRSLHGGDQGQFFRCAQREVGHEQQADQAGPIKLKLGPKPNLHRSRIGKRLIAEPSFKFHCRCNIIHDRRCNQHGKVTVGRLRHLHLKKGK